MTRLRQGRRAGRTLYEQAGPAPSDADMWVGIADTPELAAEIVAAVNTARANATGEPDPELEQLRRLRDDLSTAIWIDPDRQGGDACIGGTRIPADTIALLTASGDVTPEDVQRYYPDVTPEAARNAAWFHKRYTDAPRPDDYVSITYGDWEPSGLICHDIDPRQPDCDEPVMQRNVTATYAAPAATVPLGAELEPHDHHQPDATTGSPRPTVIYSSRQELQAHRAQLLDEAGMTYTALADLAASWDLDQRQRSVWDTIEGIDWLLSAPEADR